jgi:ribosomal protein S18 acetylase RimI-like enzyme
MINSDYIKVSVKTWHLLFNGEIDDIDNKFNVERWNNPPVDEYLSLYKKVGDRWGWTGRLLLSYDELHNKLNDHSNEVWLFKSNNSLLGFFEIDRSVKGKAEIVYLGLLPEMIGKGFGKTFLNAAIVTALGENRDQVWLHTCEYDNPNALNIYMKAGFFIESESMKFEYYPYEFINKKNRK